MLDSKFFFTLVGLVVAVFAIYNTNMTPALCEGYWGNPGRTLKVMREVHPKGASSNCGSYSVPNNIQSIIGDDPFVSRPSFQGILSPRFGNVDYGANIQYNMPSYKNQGVPRDALGMADMAREDYNEVASESNIYSDPNYTAAMDDSENTEHDGLVAVSDMTTINALGQQEQPIIYDRYIFANRQSNLRSLGCMFRGDIPIVPCGGSWFNVHPNPSIDLQPGAMNVMGGVQNETAQALGEFINSASGGYETTIAGVNMSNNFAGTTSAGNGDIQITAFP